MSGHGLVVDELPVDGDFEDAFGAGSELDLVENGRPSRSDLGCRTDSLVEIVSRNAVLDHDRVSRIDHFS